MPRAATLMLLSLLTATLHAHERGVKNTKPTKAQKDLDLAAQQMKRAKAKLASKGRYSCCKRGGSCDLCARTKGYCDCARNVAAGKGTCGECYAAWLAGRGAVRGVDAKSLQLFPAAGGSVEREAEEQSAVRRDIVLDPEIKESVEALLRAKKTLVSEKRFYCCTRGGCGHCAKEGICTCGQDLAADVSKQSGKRKGVCGDCLDGWRAGNGLFPGIALSEVTLAPMDPMDASMGPGGGESSGWYSSGTSQEPRAAPMEMLSKSVSNWTLMGDFTIFGVYTAQTGPRGRDKIFSTNWFMGMASHRLWRGTLTLRTMLSLEPLTVTGRRYPLLFAEGETAYGVPIINGQHPHDFFMELGASYQIPLGERTALNFYGGPRGEPALGPPAFPHRLSASEDPVAVISHHLQDSTHIASNVATIGLTHGPVTLEASGFHGREPGENRWALNSGGIDSFSTRLTITPTQRWSGQFSIGRINQREFTHPLRPSLRTTASLMYVRPLARGHWASSLIWGRNNDLAYTQLPTLPPIPIVKSSVLFPDVVFRPLHIVTVPTRVPQQIYNSYLAESTVLFRDKNWIWGRAELADKDSLLLYQEDPFVLLVNENRYTRVQAYTLGYERELPRLFNWLKQGIGGQVTSFIAPANLEPVYGSHPWGVQLFVRLRAAK